MLLNRLTNMETWDPLAEINQLQDEMNRLFSRQRDADIAQFYPQFNAWEGDSGIVLTAELPGLTVDNIDIRMEGNMLTVKGIKPSPLTNENNSFVKRERLSGAFSRAIKLPWRVDAEQAEAKLANGVLTLHLRRPEDEKPKKISIKAE